jgi:hypothetical protein
VVIPRICSVSIRSFPFILFPIVVLHQGLNTKVDFSFLFLVDIFLYFMEKLNPKHWKTCCDDEPLCADTCKRKRKIDVDVEDERSFDSPH